MALAKPASISNNAFKSAKWDEITAGRNFKKTDVPTLTLLCQWYAVVEQCMYDITDGDEVQVAYSNSLGDIKACPQITTMKQASAEIRALNKQLGIVDGVDEKNAKNEPRRDTPLFIIQNRQAKRARATASGET